MAYQRITVNLKGATLRTEWLKKREYRVAPAVILKEGVIDGSRGPVFYSDAENKKSAMAWNHKPLVVYHPKRDDQYVSAADPVVLETSQVGFILNARNRNKKLGVEAWFDVEHAREVDGRVLDALEAGEKVEVSTGLDYDPEEIEGEYEGQKYAVVAHNYRPDHLAVLPDKVGALSIRAGGGLLVANEDRLPERTHKILYRSIEKALEGLGFSLTDNELSHTDVSAQLSDLLAAKYGAKGQYWRGYLCSVYPDYCVFEDGGGTFRQDYTTEGDSVSLSGNRQQVERVVEYRPVGNESDGEENEETDVDKKKFDKKAYIDSLVANGHEESDRAKLEALDDDFLQKHFKPAKTKVAANEEPVKPEPKPEVKPEVKKPTFDELVANVDEDTAYLLRKGNREAKARKEQLVTDLAANESVEFSEEFLKTQKLEFLEGLAKTVDNLAANDAGGDDEESPMLKRRNFTANLGGAVPDEGRPAPKDKLKLPKSEFKSLVGD